MWIMVLLCKEKALYVKCCVIRNGVPDAQGDILDATDIKKIFTSFNNQDSFEVYHNDIPIQEVSLLENYISTNDEIIANEHVPKGSWNAVIRVDNPEIKEQLMSGDFGGVSLNNRVKTACSAGLTGHIRYSDLRDAECVIPVLISFVESPSNGVGLHVMDYDVYIQKSKNVNVRSKKNMSLLEDLKALVSKAESESESEAPSIVKDAEPVEEEDEEVVTVEEAVADDEADEEVEEPSIEKEAEEESGAEDEEDDRAEPSIEDLQTEIEALKEDVRLIKESLAEPVEEDEESEAESDAEEKAEIIDKDAEEKDEDEPIITKSAKIEVTTEPVKTHNNFYEISGRDPLTGKKLR